MNSLIDSPGTMRPMLRLALPVLAEQFLATLVVYSDTALAGQFLGEAPLAAMALLSYPVWLISGLFAFIAIGSLAMTARFVGAGDRGTAQQVANQSLMAGAVLSVLVLAALWLSAAPMVALMNAPHDAAPLATSFLRIVAFVMPAVMLLQIGPACLRGAGDTVSGMVALGVVNVVNIAVSWLLICPALAPCRAALRIPEVGFTGLAIGTATGYVCGGLIMLIWLVRGRAGLKLRWRLLRPQRDLIRRILRIGLPGGSDILVIVLCQMWFVSMIFDLGQTFAAAHGVGVRIESLAYMPGSAFQVAAATLAGQFLGARDPHRASRSVWMACLVAEVVMLAAGVVFFFGGQPLVRIFVAETDRDVIVIAAELLKIVAFALPPFALAMVLTGALRGAGDTRWPFIFSLIGLLGVRIPLAYLLTHYWHFGVHGAWYAMAADLTIRCILVSLRFHHGGWKLVTV